jgi:phospholipid-binding lipoprotein MlaA
MRLSKTGSATKIKVAAGLVAMLLVLAACASRPPDDDPDAITDFELENDPLEPTNRAIFAFNMIVDDNFLHPAAEGYRAVIPAFGRDRISDFLENLKAPLTFLNNLLQGNTTSAGTTLGRFVVNCSFGVGGIMDVAKPMGLPGHKTDFGDTLAVWGIGEGPYLMLPILGPSNPRDLVGIGVEAVADPLNYYLQTNSMKWVVDIRLGLTVVSKREGYLDPLDDLRRTSIDYYASLRSLYRQHRNAEINAIRDSTIK